MCRCLSLLQNDDDAAVHLGLPAALSAPPPSARRPLPAPEPQQQELRRPGVLALQSAKNAVSVGDACGSMLGQERQELGCTCARHGRWGRCEAHSMHKRSGFPAPAMLLKGLRNGVHAVSAPTATGAPPATGIGAAACHQHTAVYEKVCFTTSRGGTAVAHVLHFKVMLSCSARACASHQRWDRGRLQRFSALPSSDGKYSP